MIHKDRVDLKEIGEFGCKYFSRAAASCLSAVFADLGGLGRQGVAQAQRQERIRGAAIGNELPPIAIE